MVGPAKLGNCMAFVWFRAGLFVFAAALPGATPPAIVSASAAVHSSVDLPGTAFAADQDGTSNGNASGGRLQPIGTNTHNFPSTTSPIRRAGCLESPLVTSGVLQDGHNVSLFISDDDSGPGRRLVTVINGESVYVPVPGDGRPRAVAPKVKSVTFGYSKIATLDDPNAARAGWFTSGTTFVRINNFTDHRDGSVDIPIPVAAHAMFAQPSTLFIKTDRCTTKIAMNIVPRQVYGRWFPPAFVAQCSSRTTYTPTFSGQASMSSASGLSVTQQSARRHEGFGRNALYQNCGPYGALHEGGNEEGVSHGIGTDQYLLWTGQGNGSSVDVVGDCEVTKTVRLFDPDTRSIGKPRGLEKVSTLASLGVLHVSVQWKMNGPHEYCAYALVVRGQHPAELSDHWLTTFESNNLGQGSALDHQQGYTVLRWRERDPDSPRRVTVKTRNYSY